MKNPSKDGEIAQTMTQAAKFLGVPLSVVKLAKRSGADCFLASGRVDLTKLRKWLLEHPQGAPTPEKGAANQPPPEPVDLRRLESSLAAAISVEEENLRMLRAAQAREDAIATTSLTDAFQKSQKNRLLCEKAVREEKTRAGELITLDAHKLSSFKMWPPIMNCIRRIPRKVSAALSDLDAVRIEKCVDQQVEAAVEEAKKLLAWDDVEQKELACRLLLAAVCDPDGGISQQTLETVEGLREFVLAELAKKGLPTVTAGPEKSQITSEF